MMKNWHHTAWMLLIVGPLLANPPDTIFVRTGFKSVEALPCCFYHNSGTWPDPVQNACSWEKVFNNTIRLAADQTHWLRLTLCNRAAPNRSLKLCFHSVSLAQVKAYAVVDGLVDSSLVTGYLLPVDKRATQDRDMALPVLLPAGKTVDLYLCIVRRALPAMVSLSLADPVFGDGTSWIELFLPMVIGFCFLMLLAAAGFLLYFPAKENFWYLLYTIGGTGYLIASNGYGSVLIWPNAPWFEETSAAIWIALGLSGFVLFARKVLHVRQENIWADRFLLCSIGLGGMLTLSGLLLGWNLLPPAMYRSVCLLTGVTLAVDLVLIFMVSFKRALLEQHREYWWFVAIFVNLLILCAAALLFEVGWLRYSHRLHAVLLMLNVPLEIVLVQLFLIHRMVRLFTEQQQREITLIKNMERERFQFARNLHDHLASTIHSIKVWSESMVKQSRQEDRTLSVLAEKIVRNAGRAMKNIRDLEWSVNPKNETGEKLVSRLRDEAYEILTSPVDVCFDIGEGVEALTLPPEKRWHLLLVCKEAFHNMDKYAQATEATVSLATAAGCIELHIRDNGIGFDPICAKMGNGLENMKLNTERLAGRFEFASAPGKGTSIRVSIPE